MNNKKWVGLIIAILVVVLAYFLPAGANLSQPGKMSLAILVAGIVLWVMEVMPLAVTAFLLMVCLPYFGILDWHTTWAKFISPVIFFVIATFAITVALLKTNLATRIAGILISWSKGEPKKLVLGFIVGTALLSSVCNNVPACSLFMGLALSILTANGSSPGKSNLGKCLMIGVPFGAMLGGAMTPAGTSINIMAMGLLKQGTGIDISFLDWMLFGVPFAILMIPFCWLSLILIFKPEPVSDEAINSINELVAKAGKLEKNEIKILVIILTLLVLWIASTWVSWLDATGIAVMGLVAMFFPGIEVITWDEFVKGVSWEVVIMIGGVQSVASGILATGAASWLVHTALADSAVWGGTILAGAVATVVSILHVVCPVGPAIAGMATVPIAELAKLAGASPIVFTVIVGFGAAITFILPLDCVPLITYGKGYYRMGEMVKAGLFPTLCLIVICALFMPLIGHMVGL